MSMPQKSFEPEAACPLDGVRVIDMSRLVSGNMVSLQLADFGAEVLKIEDPKRGDPLRAWQTDGVSVHWKVYSRNKKSAALSLREARGGGPSRRPGRKPADAGAWLYGRHAVTAALANPDRRWRRLVVVAGQAAEALTLVQSARAARRDDGEAVQVADPADLAALLPVAAIHQGLALEVEPLAEPTLDEALQHA